MKLQESLKGLICEIASQESVIDAIKKKQKVIIYYDGDDREYGKKYLQSCTAFSPEP